MRVWAVIAVTVVACKPDDTALRNQLGGDAALAWIDLQECLGGDAPLGDGAAFVARMRAIDLGRIVDDGWPLRCAPYQHRLVDLLDRAGRGDAGRAARDWTFAIDDADAWDRLAGAIAAATLPEVEWDERRRGVPVPGEPVAPTLALGDLQPRTEPLELTPVDPGPGPRIPGVPPKAAIDKLGKPMFPSCTGAALRAVIVDDVLHIGSGAGWTAIPFAQPIDRVKPLACGADAVELVYARAGVEHVRCTVRGCAHRTIDLGARSAWVRDAVVSEGQTFVVLGGVGGGIHLIRGQLDDLATLPASTLLDPEGPAAAALAPLAGGGVVLVVLPQGDDRPRVAIRITRDGQVSDF
jgi:hypothetical protein